MASKLMLAALALVCFVAATSALKCQVCMYSKTDAGTTGEDCNDSYESQTKYSQSCPDDTYCTKMTGEEDGQESVIRGCAKTYGGCTKVGSSDITGGNGKQYCCEGDDCNSASAIIPTMALLLAALGLTKLF